MLVDNSESEVTQSCLTLCDPMDSSPPGSFVHGDSPGKNTGMGSHSLLQEFLPTQELNPGQGLLCKYWFVFLAITVIFPAPRVGCH